MMAITCTHTGIPAAGRLCFHLLASPDNDYYQRFAGNGLVYDLICDVCRRDTEQVDANLRTVCEDCFQQVEAKGFWAGTVGAPPVFERSTDLAFAHELVPLKRPLPAQLLAIKPLEAVREPVFIALDETSGILSIDAADGTMIELFRLPTSDFDLNEAISLCLSPDGRFAALANTRGRHGLVVDLGSGQITMQLLRDDYHEDISNYPIAFFVSNGRLLLVHGTEWNRLDISDPMSGELLTLRTFEPYESARKRGERPAHYLDYFHCSLSVSPDYEWILDNGWVWQPAGMPAVWSLARWLGENMWESENGPSRKELSPQYDWDSPCCWIDDRTIVLWGYSSSREPPLDGVRLYDVTTGRLVSWFPGPFGGLAFDSYLYSFSPERGTAVWDVSTGERLLFDTTLRPTCYHRGAQRFLSLLPEGALQLSRLEGSA